MHIPEHRLIFFLARALASSPQCTACGVRTLTSTQINSNVGSTARNGVCEDVIADPGSTTAVGYGQEYARARPAPARPTARAHLPLCVTVQSTAAPARCNSRRGPSWPPAGCRRR